MASGPASHVKPNFWRASPGAAREAAPEALPNGPIVGSAEPSVTHALGEIKKEKQVRMLYIRHA